MGTQVSLYFIANCKLSVLAWYCIQGYNSKVSFMIIKWIKISLHDYFSPKYNHSKLWSIFGHYELCSVFYISNCHVVALSVCNYISCFYSNLSSRAHICCQITIFWRSWYLLSFIFKSLMQYTLYKNVWKTRLGRVWFNNKEKNVFIVLTIDTP